jgi:hypothetical protein
MWREGGDVIEVVVDGREGGREGIPGGKAN